MEQEKTELTFDFLGKKYDLEYYKRKRLEDRYGQKVELTSYYASFEDEETDFFIEDELIFKLDEKMHTMIFDGVSKGEIGLRFSMADAILMHEYLQETPPNDD
jgi:hypothetical protein